MADELDIVLSDIDEIDIDASTSDDIEITISDVDDIEIMVFDYPAEIDLLTARVKTCEGKASDAISIAEQAAHTVGEHVENITNPHPTNITQNFDGVNLNKLKSNETGGTIDKSVYDWFKGLFPGLQDSSVLSFLIGKLYILKDLATRVGILENKTLFEITLAEDAVRVDITGLDITEGIPIKLIISGEGYDTQSAILRVNDINTLNFQYNVSTVYSYFVLLTYPTRYFNDFSFTLLKGNIVGRIIYSRENSGALTGGILQQSSFGLNIEKIQTISIIRAASSLFKAGTKIKLIKS